MRNFFSRAPATRSCASGRRHWMKLQHLIGARQK